MIESSEPLLNCIEIGDRVKLDPDTRATIGISPKYLDNLIVLSTSKNFCLVETGTVPQDYIDEGFLYTVNTEKGFRALVLEDSTHNYNIGFDLLVYGRGYKWVPKIDIISLERGNLNLFQLEQQIKQIKQEIGLK